MPMPTAFDRTPRGLYLLDTASADGTHSIFLGTTETNAHVFLFSAIVIHKWFTWMQFMSAFSKHRWMVNHRNEIPKPFTKDVIAGRQPMYCRSVYGAGGYFGRFPAQKDGTSWTAAQGKAWELNCVQLLRPIMPQQALQSKEWAALVYHQKFVIGLYRRNKSVLEVILVDRLCTLYVYTFLSIAMWVIFRKPKGEGSPNGFFVLTLGHCM